MNATASTIQQELEQVVRAFAEGIVEGDRNGTKAPLPLADARVVRVCWQSCDIRARYDGASLTIETMAPNAASGIGGRVPVKQARNLGFTLPLDETLDDITN